MEDFEQAIEFLERIIELAPKWNNGSGDYTEAGASSIGARVQR